MTPEVPSSSCISDLHHGGHSSPGSVLQTQRPLGCTPSHPGPLSPWREQHFKALGPASPALPASGAGRQEAVPS